MVSAERPRPQRGGEALGHRRKGPFHPRSVSVWSFWGAMGCSGGAENPGPEGEGVSGRGREWERERVEERQILGALLPPFLRKRVFVLEKLSLDIKALPPNESRYLIFKSLPEHPIFPPPLHLLLLFRTLSLRMKVIAAEFQGQFRE